MNLLPVPAITPHPDMNTMLRQHFIGRVFTSVTPDMVFTRDDGVTFRFEHEQDCCESVWLESVVGDLADLVGEPLTMAEVSTQDRPEAPESGTWTFYKFATRKGFVDVRWCGESNGYYSESVNLFVFALLNARNWDEPRWWGIDEDQSCLGYTYSPAVPDGQD